ncbi:xanthine dehydrogenase subunit D [Sesbania bispinosa]|nr:xanthine dehydrogenase subunit D [Sesbania bispinosa]
MDMAKNQIMENRFRRRCVLVPSDSVWQLCAFLRPCASPLRLATPSPLQSTGRGAGEEHTREDGLRNARQRCQRGETACTVAMVWPVASSIWLRGGVRRTSVRDSHDYGSVGALQGGAAGVNAQLHNDDYGEELTNLVDSIPNE